MAFVIDADRNYQSAEANARHRQVSSSYENQSHKTYPAAFYRSLLRCVQSFARESNSHHHTDSYGTRHALIVVKAVLQMICAGIPSVDEYACRYVTERLMLKVTI